MAQITFSGTLLDPNSDLAVGDEIRFTHVSTTGQTIKGAQSLLTIDPSGTYSVDLQYGSIMVEYKDVRKRHFTNLGVVTVNQDTTATDLPSLLNAIVPPTNAQLIQFQTIQADTETAKDAAEAAAARYESGTWVATLYDAVTAGNASPTTATGYFTRIDSTIITTIEAFTDIDTTGMTAGNELYMSLQFAPNTAVPSYSAMDFQDIALDGYTDITPKTDAARVRFERSGGNPTPDYLTVGDLTTGVSDILGITIVYTKL